MPFFSRFRRAVDASLATLGPQRFRAGGETVTCPVCGGVEFVRSPGGYYRKPLLLKVNVPWLELTGHSTSLICTHCTHILTFGRAPGSLEEME